jgi:hypothetical protein
VTIWPKCCVCHNEIVIGEICRALTSNTVAHEKCSPTSKLKVRRMNEARAWAMQQVSTASDDAPNSSQIPSSEVPDGRRSTDR